MSEQKLLELMHIIVKQSADAHVDMSSSIRSVITTFIAESKLSDLYILALRPFTGAEFSDFVIITALVNPEFRELQHVVKKLGGRMVEEGKTGIYRGELSNGEKTFYFFAASQVSPGMVSAATLATRLIEHYRPKYVVMLGIAAGFNGNRLPKGSVLIADFVADYQQGKMTNEGFKRNGTGTPLDAELRGHLDRCKDEIISEMNDELTLNLKAHIGPIVKWQSSGCVSDNYGWYSKHIPKSRGS